MKVIGWGWFYPSTILDDFSRYIVVWKLCTTMKAEDVTEMLQKGLDASGIEQAIAAHRPARHDVRLLPRILRLN